MDIRAAEISAILKDQIKSFGQEAEVSEVGQVLSVGEAPDGSRFGVEAIGERDEAHLGLQLVVEHVERGVGRVDAVAGLMHDEVRLGEPADQRRVERRVRAVAERVTAGFDA